MALLKLTDWATKRVLKNHNLTPDRRLGRGEFCVVYEDGPDAVWKLTADNIQYESVLHYLEGTHYPALLGGPGYVGEQHNDVALYLFRAERLRSTKFADAATRKLARQLVKGVSTHWNSPKCRASVEGLQTRQQRTQARTGMTLELLQEDVALPQSLREAFTDLHRMVLDYGSLALDLHGANLMVRGNDELVLNDIIVDGAKLDRL